MQNYLFKGSCGIFVALMLLTILASGIAAQQQPSLFKKIADYDGDGRADYVVTRPQGNFKIWYVLQSTAGFKAVQWGLASDIEAPGDYDGDGKSDIAVYRSQTSAPNVQHNFYILQSSNNQFVAKTITVFQGIGYVLAQQDYDGDGKTDPAIWGNYESNSGTFILESRTDALRTVGIGGGAYAIKLGDMDGDGNAESASASLSNPISIKWLNLTTGNTRTTIFGAANDQYYAVDFDGDRKGDLAVWRRTDGNWYWIRSSDNTFQALHWGTDGDTPLPADYDGDGKTDQAVYRRETQNGVYYINGSQSGFRAVIWGNPNTDSIVDYNRSYAGF